MIDWFVWLSPLILLPIILLFGFVGCTTEYADFIVGNASLLCTLEYDEHLDTMVETITVQFAIKNLELEGDPDALAPVFENTQPETITYPDIKSGGGFVQHAVTETRLLLGDEAEIRCACTITTSPDPSNPALGTPVVATPKVKAKFADENAPLFQLVSVGDSFVIQ